MRHFALSAMVAGLILAGCAATGVQVKDDQVAQFKKGETTKAEVVQVLGRPTTQMRNADGSSSLIYSYAETSTRAATFIPIVGLFAGGADTRATSATLNFDAQDKFLGYTSSESEYGTGLGARAGSINPVSDQPRKP